MVHAASDDRLLDAFLLLADAHPGSGRTAQPGDGRATRRRRLGWSADAAAGGVSADAAARGAGSAVAA
ncbi:hypothetical protein U9M48_012347 [Paspalum notatum var. saurae]|uniref:Uncharacterized protein n=1 Tax=Paspalum notatum var. saurae TaxID=547442 RepID=A0AAQ3SZP9_PASNO